jgi:hypothetical protein
MDAGDQASRRAMALGSSRALMMARRCVRRHGSQTGRSSDDFHTVRFDDGTQTWAANWSAGAGTSIFLPDPYVEGSVLGDPSKGAA